MFPSTAYMNTGSRFDFANQNGVGSQLNQLARDVSAPCAVGAFTDDRCSSRPGLTPIKKTRPSGGATVIEPANIHEAMFGVIGSPTGGELVVSYCEHLAYDHNHDTNLLSHTMKGSKERLIHIRPRGIVINEREILFVLKPTKHPILFNSLRRNPGPNGFKHAKVIYPPEFKRVVREKGPKTKNSSSGRPRRATAWLYYGDPQGHCCCGRKFRGYRGRSAHWRSKGERSEVCEIQRIQANRSRCFFCNEVISPSDRFRCIEEHTKTCAPLIELKTLIHPFHLEDMGIQEAEIRAFNWPAIPHFRR